MVWGGRALQQELSCSATQIFVTSPRMQIHPLRVPRPRPLSCLHSGPDLVLILSDIVSLPRFNYHSLLTLNTASFDHLHHHGGVLGNPNLARRRVEA